MMDEPLDCTDMANGHMAMEIERQQAVIARLQKINDDAEAVILRQRESRHELLAAAINLRNVAGRYHTEQAFKALMDVVAKYEVKP
jgi:hypothetical protein